LKSISPPLANNLALLSREMVDLLKTCPHCTMSFNRFIPAYHHHFGRQCRVADYGFTKLIDLLESLPNIVQVFEFYDYLMTPNLDFLVNRILIIFFRYLEKVINGL